MKSLIKLFKHKDSSDNLVLIKQKIILKVDLHDDKAKQKVMKLVSTFTGIDIISMDMEENKLTIIGKVDPVKVVSKLRKKWRTYILIVGPAEDQEKDKLELPNNGGKNEEVKKKEDGKNELAGGEDGKNELPGGADGKNELPGGADGKKEESKQKVDGKKQKGDGKNVEAKKKGGKKEEEEVEIRSYNRPSNPYYYVPLSMEENPNACVIS